MENSSPIEKSLTTGEIATKKTSCASSCFRCFKNLFYFVGALVLVPLYITLILLILIIWFVLTITGIGPLLHWCYSRKDANLLLRKSLIEKNPELKLITIPGGINAASGGLSYQIVARWVTPETPSTKPPVIFPNGLAATQIFLSRPQDMLRDKGFSSLTFDRMGCGFSDPNPSGIAPSAVDICKEMDYVMNNVGVSPDTKWIAVGGSMGNTVCQAYLTIYPDRFLGLLNLDGLPYPYVTDSKAFAETYAGQYKFMAGIMWTGIFRFFNSFAMNMWDKNSRSTSFSALHILAQMNSRSFFDNTVLEFKTMMR